MKESVIQFGEGGFLRSFVDVFFDKMNDKGLYDGKVVVVQPIEKGLIDVVNEQHGEYHQFLRGRQGDKVVNEYKKIKSISRGVNPYVDFDAYLELAHNPQMRVIVSNTTEAGIEYLGTEKITDRPAKSFPAKLTQLLYERFKAGLGGFIILSCELIDNNGGELRECVLKYAKLWELGSDFEAWIANENHFCNTLVDRICTGYPKDEAEELEKQIGEKDKLLNTAEVFHLWVIEGHFEDEIPLQKAGVNVIWTDDVRPYKKRKVRILNGAHTSMVLAARLCGLETVGECLADKDMYAFLSGVLFDEIVPCLGNSEEYKQFARDVLERFANPFVKHKCESIALNSVSKFKARVLPTILDIYKESGKLPVKLTFSLAALIKYYKTMQTNDGEEIMEFMKTASVDDILARADYWGQDLSFMGDEIKKDLAVIDEKGMREAIRSL